MPGNDGRTDGIPKPDFVSHFEAITQLNLKMESEELLTAEELGRALKYLFSRYHGVLDSVGEFKAQLDGENAELRAQIFSLRQQLLNNNAEVLRLKPDFVLMRELELWNVPKGYAGQIAESAKKAGIPINQGDKWQ